MDALKAQPPQETKLHFLDYWRIIRIRKTVILAVFLLVVVATFPVVLPFVFLDDLPAIHPKDHDFHGVLNTAAMASCYAPNPQAPCGFDLPFDEQTGEWRPDVWARWKEWDPIDLVGRYRDALAGLRLLYLDCGTRDEFNLQFGARTFCARLDRKGIRYRYEEFDDGHMNIPYRYDVSLAAMSDVWRG